jgi:hypothetical protein
MGEIRHYGAVAGAAGQAQAAAAPVRLHWRLYRLYLIPVAVAVLIVAFAFGNQATPLSSTLVPEGFDGARAFALLKRMAAIAPGRAPGSSGDERLLGFVAGQLRSLGDAGDGGYALRRLDVDATTSLGGKRLEVLVARRPGSRSEAPILLVAHRDSAASAGDARAQLSGTAALLELASVLAGSETKHPVELVFSDGGSAGGGGISAYLHDLAPGRLDAALVLGDLAGEALRDPLVQPYSNALGSAPEALQRTVSAALRDALHSAPGAPGLLAQLAHLAFPLSVGEQGILDAAGVPAVSVGLAGESGTSAREAVSEGRLQAAGHGVLSAFYALDGTAEVATGANVGLALGERTLPGWALRLLIGSLLLAPLALSVDALVRLSRRGRQAGRWISLAISCALPIFGAAIVVKLLAAVGLLAAPGAPVPAEGLSLSAGAALTLALALLALLAGARLWWRGLAAPLLARAGGPSSGGVAALCVACLIAAIVWIVNPFAALLLIPALHIWPLVLDPELRPAARGGRIALALLPLLPLGLLLAYYAVALGFGPGSLLLSALLLLGGGQVGWGGALIWSLAFGLLATVVLAAAVSHPDRSGRGDGGATAGASSGRARRAGGARTAVREPAARLARAANRV